MADVDARQAALLQSVSLSELGARIKAARLAAGLTQTQLGTPEVTVSYVSRIESGRRRPDPRVLDAFAGRLGVSVEDLLAPLDAVEDHEPLLAVDFVALSLELGDATDALAQADALLADPSSTPGGLRERLEFLRGRALEALGRLDEAIEAFEDLLAAHPRGAFTLSAGVALSRCHRESGDLGGAISVGEQLLATVAERGLAGSDEAVQLTVTVAAAYHERGDVRHAVRMCRDAIQVAEVSGSPRSRAAAYWNASIMELDAGAPAAAVEMASRALALLGEDTDSRNFARLRSQLGIMQMQLDPPEVSEAIANLSAAGEQMALSSAGRIDHLRNDAALARATMMSGDAMSAQRMAAEVFERSREMAPFLAAEALSLQGQALAADGDTAAAARLYKEAVLILTGVGADRSVGHLWLELGTLLDSVGEHDAARQAYRSAAVSAGLQVRPQPVRRPSEHSAAG